MNQNITHLYFNIRFIKKKKSAFTHDNIIATSPSQALRARLF